MGFDLRAAFGAFLHGAADNGLNGFETEMLM